MNFSSLIIDLRQSKSLLATFLVANLLVMPNFWTATKEPISIPGPIKALQGLSPKYIQRTAKLRVRMELIYAYAQDKGLLDTEQEHSFAASMSAVDTMLIEQATDQANHMSDNQLRKYAHKHAADFIGSIPTDTKRLREAIVFPLTLDLKDKLLKKLANEYTVISDGPEILEATREIKAGKID